MSRYAREEIIHETEQEEIEMEQRELQREQHDAGLCAGPLECGECIDEQNKHHAGMCNAESCGYCKDAIDERAEKDKHEGSYEDSFGRLVKE
jgi:hypothetical protein